MGTLRFLTSNDSDCSALIKARNDSEDTYLAAQKNADAARTDYARDPSWLNDARLRLAELVKGVLNNVAMSRYDRWREVCED